MRSPADARALLTDPPARRARGRSPDGSTGLRRSPARALGRPRRVVRFWRGASGRARPEQDQGDEQRERDQRGGTKSQTAPRLGPARRGARSTDGEPSHRPRTRSAAATAPRRPRVDRPAVVLALRRCTAAPGGRRPVGGRAGLREHRDLERRLVGEGAVDFQRALSTAPIGSRRGCCRSPVLVCGVALEVRPDSARQARSACSRRPRSGSKGRRRRPRARSIGSIRRGSAARRRPPCRAAASRRPSPCSRRGCTTSAAATTTARR